MKSPSVSSSPPVFPAWKDLLALCKVRITAAVMITMAVGYLLRTGRFEWGMVLPTVGAFLLACGSFALNQLQERGVDARMDRTRRRPLPAGRVSPAQVAGLVLGLYVLGSVLCYWGGNGAVLGLGWLTIFWYNGVYVGLKRVTALAVIPGSLVGALPPMMGWAAAGGALLAPEILAVAFFIFVWQVPHFWLLLFLYGKQYEEAGLPSLTARYSHGQLAWGTFWGFVATALAAFGMSWPGFVPSYLVSSLLCWAASLWLLYRGVVLIRAPEGSRLPFRRGFADINLYTLAILLVLCVDRMVVAWRA